MGGGQASLPRGQALVPQALTVATEPFVPGAFVMIGTFLKAPSGFDGDAVVVQDGLSAASREMLRTAFGRSRFPNSISGTMLGRAA